MNSQEPNYLHGFSSVEQARLMKQARLLENTIFGNIDYTGVQRLLEVGSGVGAQTEILLRRFPELHVTCVDAEVEGDTRFPKIDPAVFEKTVDEPIARSEKDSHAMRFTTWRRKAAA